MQPQIVKRLTMEDKHKEFLKSKDYDNIQISIGSCFFTDMDRDWIFLD